MEGLSLIGSAKPLLIKPIQLEPPRAPALPTLLNKNGRPSITSSLHDMRTANTMRPLLVVNAIGARAGSRDGHYCDHDATGSGSSSTASGQQSPPPQPKLITSGKYVPRAPEPPRRAHRLSADTGWPTGGGGSGVGASSGSGRPLASEPTAAEVRAEAMRAAHAANMALEGYPAQHGILTGAPPPPPHGGGGLSSSSGLDAAGIEAQRLKAVRRLREQREQREQQEADEKQRAADAKADRKTAEQRTHDRRERAEQKRAEVYAINKLMAARDEASYIAFAAARHVELEEVERRHAEEIEQEQKEKQRLEQSREATLQKRLRAAAEEVKLSKQKDDEEALGRKAAAESKKEEIRSKEEEREIFRAQVYAINKLMTARDAAAFEAFKKARGIVDDEPPASPTREAGSLRDSLRETASVRARPGSPRHAHAKAAETAAASERQKNRRASGGLVSRSACGGWAHASLSSSLRSSAEGGAGGGSGPAKASGRHGSSSSKPTSGDQDALMASTLGSALSRTWGGPGDRANDGSNSGDERDAAIVARLVRPREGQRDLDLDADGKRLKKAGTVWQQQRNEEVARESRRKMQREEASAKNEEREVARAQIYAINRLMRAREESAFEEFKLRREAEELGSPSPPSPQARAIAAAEAAERAAMAECHSPRAARPTAQARAAEAEAEADTSDVSLSEGGGHSSEGGGHSSEGEGGGRRSAPPALPPPPPSGIPPASPSPRSRAKLDQASRLLHDSPYAKASHAHVADAAAAAY